MEFPLHTYYNLWIQLLNLYHMHYTIMTAYVHWPADPSQSFVFSIVIPLCYIARLNFLCSEKNTTDKNVVNSLNLYNMFQPIWLAVIG